MFSGLGMIMEGGHRPSSGGFAENIPEAPHPAGEELWGLHRGRLSSLQDYFYSNVSQITYFKG